MALDLTIIARDRTALATMPIEDEAHDRLMAAAGRAPFLRRMQDYYANARFDRSELPALRAELTAIAAAIRADAALGALVARLQAFVDDAIARGADLAAYAD
ncbi:MAG: hypothetical protein K8W52_46750 [Deltaproteobacteria bacterium]|nr:hypothetical protein [Deltaproteobacteria bacterium]